MKAIISLLVSWKHKLCPGQIVAWLSHMLSWCLAFFFFFWGLQFSMFLYQSHVFLIIWYRWVWCPWQELVIYLYHIYDICQILSWQFSVLLRLTIKTSWDTSFFHLLVIEKGTCQNGGRKLVTCFTKLLVSNYIYI